MRTIPARYSRSPRRESPAAVLQRPGGSRRGFRSRPDGGRRRLSREGSGQHHRGQSPAQARAVAACRYRVLPRFNLKGGQAGLGVAPARDCPTGGASATPVEPEASRHRRRLKNPPARVSNALRSRVGFTDLGICLHPLLAASSIPSPSTMRNFDPDETPEPAATLGARTLPP